MDVRASRRDFTAAEVLSRATGLDTSSVFLTLLTLSFPCPICRATKRSASELTTGPIVGRRAYEIGLIDHIVNTDTFDDEVNVVVEKYSRVCSEGARQSKVLLNMAFDMPHGQFFDEYLRRQRIALGSADHQEAMAAYREKREPVFST